MNYLRSSIRVKLGLTNPYQIKSQFKLLSEEVPFASAILQLKHKINYDSYVIRFKFEENKCLGRKIGQYIQVQYNGDKRGYVPISRIDDAGFVDLLVRDMSKINKFGLSKKLISLNEGTQVILRGPMTQFIYNGYGSFQYNKTKRKARYVGILTQATAITTTFSLIQSIATNFDSETSVSLLWMADNKEDFVLLDELLSFQKQKKLNMNLLLTELDKDWVGPYGKLTHQHIKDFLAPPNQQTIIIISGADNIIDHMRKCVEQVGHKHLLVL